MIKIKITYERTSFADSLLAKLLIKLARWRNWQSNTRVSQRYDVWGDLTWEDLGSYISETRWNFRLASKITTYFKRREENRAADELRNQLNPAAVELATQKNAGNGLDFDPDVYYKLYNNHVNKDKNEPS